MGISSLLAALAVPALTWAAAIPQLEAQIVGGVEASAGDFPFIVSIQSSGSHFCGGSLLNANTVLSAGHCGINQSPSRITIRAGSLNRNSGGTVAQVSSITVHPDFDYDTLVSDVAIFKLATPIPTSSTISYAKLPAAGTDPVAGVTHTVAGWGTLSSGSGSLPTTLRKVDVPIIARATCAANYASYDVTDTMFCAGFAAGGKDSCQGDSGGPIVDSSKTVVGTVSWGIGCAGRNAPGVYARVASLLTFINSKL